MCEFTSCDLTFCSCYIFVTIIVAGIFIAIAIIAACINWRKKLKKYLPMLFNIFAFMLIVIALTLQAIGIKTNWFKSSELIALVTITTALVVGVFTVLSLAISLHKEKIWGINVGDFRTLAGFKKSHSHMIITFLVLIALNILAMLLSCEIACIVISIISIGYTIYFCRREIPILAREEERLWEIVKENIKYEKGNAYRTKKDGEEKTEEKDYMYIIKLPINITNVISHLLFEKNIKEIYENLSCKSTESEHKRNNAILLDYILRKQNEVLLFEKNYVDFSITQLHKSVIENIEAILSFKKDFNVSEFLEEYPNLVSLFSDIQYPDYHIARSLLTIANSETNIVNNELNKDIIGKFYGLFMGGMFRPLKYGILDDGEMDEKKNSFLFKILTTMLLCTVNDGKNWFLKILREDYKDDIGMDADNNICMYSDTNMLGFLVVICWFLYYAQKEDSPTNKIRKDFVQKFINENDKENLIKHNINKGYNWKELYKIATEFGCLEYSNFNVKILLDIYITNTWNEIYTFPTYNIREYLPEGEEKEEESLLNWFFEMLLSSNCGNIDPEKMFEGCEPKEKIRIANYLKREWTDDKIATKTFDGQKFFDSDRECLIKLQENAKNIKNLTAWANRNSP